MSPASIWMSIPIQDASNYGRQCHHTYHLLRSYVTSWNNFTSCLTNGSQTNEEVCNTWEMNNTKTDVYYSTSMSVIMRRHSPTKAECNFCIPKKLLSASKTPNDCSLSQVQPFTEFNEYSPTAFSKILLTERNKKAFTVSTTYNFSKLATFFKL